MTIVYKSNTGFTQEYAEMLGRSTHRKVCHWEEALSRLEAEGAAAVLSRLGPGSGFRVLPYRAVGVRSGLLLCFRADRARADGRELGEITVALSPGAVSEGGAAALWGGETGKEGGGHAA